MKSSFRALPGRLFTIVNALVVLWLFALWWGERTVFQESLEMCDWGNWEQWVSGFFVGRIETSISTNDWFLVSLKMPRLTASPSSPIRSLSTPTHTPVVRGLCRR